MFFLANINLQLIFRYNGIFLSLNRSLAKLSQVPDGSAHIRISRNEVDGAGSETPTAKIVIHVYTGRKSTHLF